jgi:hypothetical protein
VKCKFIPMIALSVFLCGASALAYDEDTHFYQTYSMARFAGIRHEVAVKIALSTQWMDESFISDPMSMMVDLPDGVKKRRLLHFPSSRDGGSGNMGTQQQLLGFNLTEAQQAMANKFIAMLGGSVDLNAINIFTETKEADPMSTQLLMEGLKEGSLMKASASLHSLEDSFAHAGTPAESGHAVWWHWPDRPFASVPKFFDMVHSVLPAIVAIRTLLPPDALDCSLRINSKGKFNGGTPNCQQDGETLADQYSGIPMLKKIVSYNAIQDPEYIRTALLDFYDRSIKKADVKYLNISRDQFNALYDSLKVQPGSSAYDVLQQMLQNMLVAKLSGQGDPINIDGILKDMNLRDPASCVPLRKYIDSFGDGHQPSEVPVQGLDPTALKKFTSVLARDMLEWHVPLTLSDTHRQELEDDGVIRAKEMEIRVQNVQKLIYGLYGTKLIFVGNNTISKKGFGLEVRLDPSCEPDYMKNPAFKNDPDAVYATFSGKEKNAWDHMIFKYLFPSAPDGTLEKVTEMILKVEKFNDEHAAYMAARKEINDSDSNFLVKKAKLIALDARSTGDIGDLNSAVANVVTTLQPLAKGWLHDLVSTHVSPSPDNLYWQDPDLFGEYVQNGTLKKLLGEKDVWTLEDLKISGPAPASVKSAAGKTKGGK